MRRLLIAFLLLCAGLTAAQTPVSGNKCSSGSNDCTMTLSYVSGDLILVGGWSNSGTGVTFTVCDGSSGVGNCTGSNTFTQIGSTSTVGSPLNGKLQAWLLVAPSTGSKTIDIHCSSNSQWMGGVVEQYSGGENTFDQSATGGSTSNSTSLTTSNTSTTGAANELVVGLFFENNLPTWTAGSGYTIRQTQTGSPLGGILEDKTVSSTGAYNATATSSANVAYAGLVLTFCSGTCSAPTVDVPTFSPNGIPLDFATSHNVTCNDTTSGSSCIYTLDGTTPGTGAGNCTPTGTGASVAAGGTITISASGVTTLKALGCFVGDTNSSVTSATFNLYPDQQLATDTFGEFYNSNYNVDTINAIPTQLPLDTAWTGETISATQVSAWQGMGTSSGVHLAYPASDSLGTYGARGPGSNVFGYASRTAETYPAGNQYGKMFMHINGAGAGTTGVAVGTSCGTGSSFSGNVLTVNNAASNNVQLYIAGSLQTTITLAASDGDLYEMRQLGTTIQPLKNGAQVTGLNATYITTAATGVPCFGVTGSSDENGNAAGYNWSGGAVATSNPGVTPIAWGGNTYSNYSLDTTAPATPPWMPDGTSASSLPTTGTIVGNFNSSANGGTAIGTSSGVIHQGHYLAPVTNNQWVHALITLDDTAWNNRNWFLKLEAQPFLPPSILTNAVSGCYDSNAIYIGDEPFNRNLQGCSSEYCGTDFLHVTYNNNYVSNQAQATATLSGSGVGSVAISSSQTGIAHVPLIYFSGGGGSGAAAHAVLTGGVVTAIVVDTAGTGYTSPPTVWVIPYDGANQACNAIANYNIITGLTTQYAPMHGDEILAKFENNTLSIYCKGGSTIGGWTATTAVTPAVISSTSGTSGTVIQTSNGLYQLVQPNTFLTSYPYVLNQYVNDGSHWQKVTTEGTSAGAPTWNHSGGTSTTGTVTFTDQGVLTTPTTGATQPSPWGETATNVVNGAITLDGKVTWQYVGEACSNDTAFQFLGSTPLAGFNQTLTQYAPGMPGIWSSSLQSVPTAGMFDFQDVHTGNGDPCSGTYTCVQPTPYVPMSMIP